MAEENKASWVQSYNFFTVSRWHIKSVCSIKCDAVYRLPLRLPTSKIDTKLMKKLSRVKYRWHEKADFQESSHILRFDVSPIDRIWEHFFCRDVQAVQLYVAPPVRLNTPKTYAYTSCRLEELIKYHAMKMYGGVKV
jgi:hypothetical protein